MSLMSDFEAYAETRDPALREKLIEENLPLVYLQAGRLVKTLPREIRLDDLTSWGSDGLIDAVEKFEPERGWKFSSYACIRIRGAMLDGLQTQEWLPKPLISKIRALGNAQDILEEAGEDKWSASRLAEIMGIDESEVGALVRERAAKNHEPLHLGESDDGDDDDAYWAQGWVATAGEHEPSAELAEILLRIGAVVAKLKFSERMVIVCVYEQGMSLKELAKFLDVAPGNAAALHQKVLAKIRDGLALFDAAS